MVNIFQYKRAFIAAITIFILALPTWLGFRYGLPGRQKDILPPTSENNLCRYDKNYFYSSLFKFCMKFDNEQWRNSAIVAAPRFPLFRSYTAIDFYLPYEKPPKNWRDLYFAEHKKKMFTIFIDELNEENLKTMKKDEIAIVYQSSPYVIGIKKVPEPLIPIELINEYHHIEQMVKNITVFYE